MKDGVKQVVGKTISSVVVARNADAHPRNQIFLVFSDGTSFEFWGESFSCAGGLDRKELEEVIRYAEKGGASISNIYPDSNDY